MGMDVTASIFRPWHPKILLEESSPIETFTHSYLLQSHSLQQRNGANIVAVYHQISG